MKPTRMAVLAWFLCGAVAHGQGTIYTDALGSGWQDWSWSSAVNFANASTVYTGTHAIAITSAAWGALSLNYGAVTSADFGTLEFYIHGGAAGGQAISLLIENDSPAQSFGPVALATSNLVAGTWRKVVIPLSAFGVSTPTFDRIDWQNNSAGILPTYYLDDIRLVPASASPPVVRGGWAAGLREVTAFFNQALDAAALGAGTYELQNAADPSYTGRVAGAFLRYDAARSGVTALFPGDVTTNGTYSFHLRGIAGTNGMAIDSNTVVTFSLRRVDVGIDAMSGLHPISPYIYGMAFAPDAGYLAGAGVTVNRWGGNNSTRYNWKIGAANLDNDWYFENVDWGGGNDSPTAFITRNAQAGAASLISIPALGWVAKDQTSYSYSVAKYGAQQGVDPYWPDRGNGIKPLGQPVSNDITDTSVPSRAFPSAGDPTNAVYQDEWLESLAAHFSAVTPKVLPFLAIDNEPELWSDTHRDVHPVLVTYDELYERFTNYAAMCRSVAPGAMIFGPVDSSWWFYWNSQAGWDDKTAHGNKDFLPWWLQKVHSNDVAAGHSSIDVLDIHYYPNDVFNDDISDAVRAERLRCTRGFWDPTYVDEGWIGADHFATYSQPNSNAVMLLPRFQAIISNCYPGLKLALTEWNVGAEADMSGALAVADVLGIFGRENLWLSTYWSFPPSNSPTYQVFRLYGNCDGAGRAFEKISVRTVAGGTNEFGAYAARSESADRLTVLVLNKNPTNDAMVRLTLTNFTAGATATVYRLTSLATTIQAEPGVTATGATTTVMVPAYSATLYDFRAIPPDGDHDGLSDAFELLYPAASDPNADADGDGVANGAECAAGTDPTDSNSVLRMAFSVNDTNWLASWPTSRGRRYVIDGTGSITNGWSGIGTNAGFGSVLFQQGPRTNAATFLRIRVN